MSREEILDIFYNYIVPEAFNGRVNCYFMYNILFYTRIPQRNLFLVGNGEDYGDLMIPTLEVNDCSEFEQLLVDYVKKALEFYDNANFCEEILNSEVKKLGNGISKEKVVMTLLWSNATIEDFNNPYAFLRKRIAYFNLANLQDYRFSKITGYSEVLGADIECSIKKAKIENETPYYFQSFLLSPSDGERIYEFPRIYFGISDGNVSVYAIQNGKNRLVNDKYVKKLERKMYKVNDGLDVKEDNYDNYGVGNLKDITPSFLVGINIFVGILKNLGIKRLDAVSILASRWNSKIIAMDFKRNILTKKNDNIIEVEQLIDDYYNKVIAIQSNLTEKFIRVFRRICYHHSSVGILSYPMEISSNLSMCLYDQDDICNNKLLDETFRVNRNNSLKR